MKSLDIFGAIKTVCPSEFHTDKAPQMIKIDKSGKDGSYSASRESIGDSALFSEN